MTEQSSPERARALRLEDLLGRDIYDVDEEPHITVDYEKCSKCDAKPCLYLCPAGCYTLSGNRVLFSYEGCLECGTCRAICPMGAVRWSYPKSGRGVFYRFT
ncbi:MAG: 4Fe-4S dicluster domain-containing protein [Desulfurococcales archaeon]|nr:4Fe-4S dicluster domain-containing protein [Desulfurococcales archaeon]